MRVLLSPNVCKTLWRSVHLYWSPNKKLDKKIWDRYRNLPIADCKVQVTYVWVDGTGDQLRSKTRTLDWAPSSHKDCPSWDLNGHTCVFTDTHHSDMILCPVAVYKDPITQGSNKIALCETYTEDGKPSKTNFRFSCMEALNKICDKEPMFGYEQEYHLMDVDQRPFGWPVMRGEPAPGTHYCCAVGADRAFGREVIESHYRCCLHCGIEICGVKAEANPAQWEFKTGPTEGIKAADDLWVARYLLQRVAEDYGVAISYHPKLFPNWYGAGCHTTFSTKEMREAGGLKQIEEAITKLEKKHSEHIAAYDSSGLNRLRLTGKHETSLADKFTSGVGDRGTSVRISRRVAQAKKGYLEDRRPAANVDPYRVITALVRTVLLNE